MYPENHCDQTLSSTHCHHHVIMPASHTAILSPIAKKVVNSRTNPLACSTLYWSFQHNVFSCDHQISSHHLMAVISMHIAFPMIRVHSLPQKCYKMRNSPIEKGSWHTPVYNQQLVSFSHRVIQKSRDCHRQLGHFRTLSCTLNLRHIRRLWLP